MSNRLTKSVLLLLTLVVVALYSSFAQTPNLVPNGNFEQYSNCPTNQAQVSQCTGWRQYTNGTSDYFNTCATGWAGVPANFLGYQYAASGSGYVGFIGTLTTGSNLKEYVATTISSMQIGRSYEVSLSVSLADTSNFACDDLGIFFYQNGSSTIATNNVLPVNPQIFLSLNNPITNKNQWVRFMKTFIPDSAYTNIVIGCFKSFNSLKLDTVSTTGRDEAYYYIDSVVVRLMDTITMYYTGDTSLCAGDTISIPYSINAIFNSGNIFQLQLSDAVGSFSSPTTIGSISGPSAGTIKGVIPTSVSSGYGYKLRIVSTNPAFISASPATLAIGGAKPTKPTIIGNTPLCEKDTLRLTATSTSGVNYIWAGPNSFISNQQNPIIANIVTAASGQYIVTAYLYGCKSKDTINVIINSYPTNVAASSNSPICAGDSLKFTSSSSTSGVSYSWAGPGGFSSTLQNPFRINTTTTMSGNYMDTISKNGCKIIDTVTVIVKPLPGLLNPSGNGPLCTNASLNLNITATSGANYSWTGPNSFISTAQNPIRLYMTTADSGNYVVIANLNGCTLKDSIHVTVYPVTPKPTASANNPVCLGAILNLNASIVPNAIYYWTGPNNFFSPLQNTKISNVNAANAGTYKVTAKLNGCVSAPDSVVISTIPGPSVSAYANPGSTICTGTSVALVAVPTNIGTNPAVYQWYQNNNAISGATNVSYIAPSPSNGDVFNVQLTASTVCNSAVSSNNINIITLPATPPPAATIAASPGTDIWPYLNVNFNVSNLSNGGSTPSYQWRLNGKDITGATTNKWNSTELKDGDSVCLWVTSSDQCATPKSTLSNCLKMKVPTGLSPLQRDLEVSVYPNPVSKELIIEGANIGSTIQVNNIIGQTVYRGVINSNKETINTIQWAEGAYLLYSTDKDGNRVVRKVVKE